MFHVVLYEPEIPPNTGNIIRLCANTGTSLHLIKPLGFTLADKQLKRAGLDYHEWAQVCEHESFDHFVALVRPTRMYACSTRGKQRYSNVGYEPGDALLFGPETRGLPQSLLDSLMEERIITIPMQADSRSMNLSNAVAVILYEAWRQQGFVGGSDQPRDFQISVRD